MFKHTTAYILTVISFMLISMSSSADEYAVGVTYFTATDYSRTEHLTPNHADYREILIKIWYPTTMPSPSASYLHFHTEQFPYSTAMPTDNDIQLHQYLKTLPFELSKNAPLAQSSSPFPVVMYSHGYQSTVEDKEILMIALAKKGYIAVSVGHPHHAQFVTLSDGQSATYDQDARANDFYISELADVNFEELVAELDSLAGVDLNDEQVERVYQLMSWTEGDRKGLDLWVADMHFALDQLTRLQYGQYWGMHYAGEHLKTFKGQLDLSQLAAIGLSFGGPTVAAFCHQVYQCKGAINFDGLHFNLSPTMPSLKPYLMMHSELPLNGDYSVVFNQQIADTYMLQIDGALHWDFSDYPYVFPFDRNRPYLGSIDPYLVTDIVNSISLKFIDAYLKKTATKTELTELLESYAPVRFKSKLDN
ncbi:hypothetical protein N473_19670 [Pseudoalteromonas luteoviolacea CPMOR-1]|uniref:Platelet-activating factor acetylhydrolase n=1 Tax=Pseudoalteromonas luteoviolacea CPMOR-1 TaxID=1365248 RepID=A0A167K9E1_9GAMM|nr:hypothetical protein [Pseudoalteromonas luteoviolacea]KZN62327.1 hypothetical protein N473_19670 [Pseudoalteromonas luteoviolacea CPMOR-1]